MARERTLTVKILGDSSGAQRALSQVDGATGKVGGGIAKFGAAAAAGFAAAGVAAFAFGKSAVDAAVESAKVTKQTEAVLKSMGDAAGVTAGQVGRLATSLSLKSGVDDEVIQSSQNVLLTFGKVRNEVGEGNNVFARATKAALDMSVALGTDMQSATLQVGKALNDPIAGITALSRAGVSFTVEQKETIKTLVEEGRVLDAQKIILKELETQFGGSAEAQATAGAKLKVAFGNIQEEIGARLLPVVERLATWVADRLPAAMAFAGDAFAVGRDIFNTVKQAIIEIQPVVEQVVAVVGQKFAEFRAFAQEVFPQVQEAIGHFIEVIKTAWGIFGDDILRVASEAFSQVKLVIETALAIIQNVIRLVLAVINGDWGKAWEALRGIVTAVWDGIKGTIGNAIGAIVGVIGGAGSAIRSAARGMWDGIWEAFRSAINRIIGAWNRLRLSISIPKDAFGIPIPGGGRTLTIGTPYITPFAEGGIVTSPTLALIGEAGPEAVVPLGRGATAAAVGGGITVIFNGPIFGEGGERATARRLVEAIHSELLRKGLRNTAMGLA